MRNPDPRKPKYTTMGRPLTQRELKQRHAIAQGKSAGGC